MTKTISIEGYGDGWEVTFDPWKTSKHGYDFLTIRRKKQDPMPELKVGMFLISKNSWPQIQSDRKFLKDYIIEGDELCYHEDCTLGIPLHYAESNKDDILYIYQNGSLVWQKDKPNP